MKLNELYRNLTSKPNSPESFIANVIYTGYRANRKKMLQGLYNIINGGPKHYWNPCHVTLAPFKMETILCTPVYPSRVDKDGRDVASYSGSIKEIDIDNLGFYA